MAVIDIHTGIITSPKHAPLSDGAFRLWMHALCWSKEHLTDGFLPSKSIDFLHPKAKKFVGELLDTIVPGKGPLWHEVDGGYQVHDYAEWQETKAKVQDRRRMWRETKRGQRVESTKESIQVSNMDTSVESQGSPLAGSGSGSGSGVRVSKEKKAPSAEGASVLFAMFWQSYPRRTGKQAAAKAFARLKPNVALVDQMQVALSWQKQTDQWQRGIVPHPATWLNGRRWEDERPVNGTHRDEPIRQVDWSNV